MAPKGKKPRHFTDELHEKDEYTKYIEDIKEHPWRYVIALVFVAVCIITAAGYRLHLRESVMKGAGELVTALDEQDSAKQLETLGKLAEKKGPLQAEALYFLGETALRGQDYAKARESFEKLTKDYADTKYAPLAAEGLGFILENDAQDAEGALAQYQSIATQWPDSFSFRVQPLNVGRCQEKLGRLPEAIKAYEEQVVLFAGSNAAEDAQAALDRLKTTNPELFPKEEATTPETPASAEAAPATDTPVPDMPVTDAPLGEAPAGDVVPATGEEAPKLTLPDLSTADIQPEGEIEEQPAVELTLPALPESAPATEPAVEPAAPPAELAAIEPTAPPAEPAPVEEPVAPPAEPTPVAEPAAPVAEPAPVVEPAAPVAEPTPETPAPAAEPTPVVDPAITAPAPEPAPAR